MYAADNVTTKVMKKAVSKDKLTFRKCCNRGVGTGPAGPATAGPMFPEPTIKNIIPLFVIKQIKSFYIIAAYLCHLIKELHYYIIERTRYQSS